ncbi:MAG: DUF4397 domain-containing protein [Gemmatimonadota bacterium]|nr:DUF4397 domain-containing protein [Gemmatimonadota bacterium]
MQLSRLTTLLVAVAALAACGKDKVTDPAFPALAGVRFINGVNDTSAIDIRAMDQVEFSPVGNALAYRAATEHQPTEAKDRHFRAFITSTNPAITSNPIIDFTVTFAANSRYTVLLTGGARTTVNFVLINDDAPTPAAGQIGIRSVNASTGAIDAYVVDSTVTPLGSPAATNVAPLTTAPYVGRAAGKVAMRVTPAGSATVAASQQGPPAPAQPAGALPAAGVTTAGTPFSVYFFPAGVPGSPTAPATGTARCTGTAPAAACTPTIVWFVDRVPTS